MRIWKRAALLALCLLTALMLCACKQNPSPEKLYAKLLGHFQAQGYDCTLEPLADENRAVPIYKASAWKRLLLDGAEEVLVYFDESNRADYLSSLIDGETYRHVTRFGLRFVLVYEGEDAGVLAALAAIEND